ncbi:urea transporter [Synechococcus sp. BA-124 BA4]|uniref:urea transporter n=1 Tax=Synechococcus sp. BA-124 BA4 TaxID=3110251 RepID=UPI002B21D0A9|nr:urea transporter [Synechococcus sp. BA-124 BA4]MEA5400827.1 urea transporter [Synechococcus sp. BA-124 BA4]
MPPAASPLPAYELLQGFLKAEPPGRSGLEHLLPSSGTLPGITRLGGHHPLAHTLVGWLRSCGQVIFINNPLSGLLLLLAMALQSFWAAALTLLGIVAAHLVARAIGADRQARRNGIYGFNGALVGGAVAALADHGTAIPSLAWLLLTVLGAGLTTLLVHGLGRWLVRVVGLPPLTLPFCLVTWSLLLLAAALAHPELKLLQASPPESVSGPLVALLQAMPKGFGQVFFCSNLLSGSLVLLAVVVASPMAGLVGVAGALVGGLTGLGLGAPAADVAQGLWSFDGVLTAIAVAGVFYPLNRLSLGAGLAGAALGSLLMVPLGSLLQAVTGRPLPVLTLPFIVSTALLLLLLKRMVPTLIPVGLHSILTPEEHRRRFDVARRLMGDFRRQLRGALAGDRHPSLLARAEPALVTELETLFASLDQDQNRRLSVAELAEGLGVGAADGAVGTDQLATVLQASDLDGDGSVDAVEFSELLLRLRRLHEGEERLLQYLLPIDGDGNDHLDPAELNRLLRSVGQAPLEPAEQSHVFGAQLQGLTWKQLLDRLLLI